MPNTMHSYENSSSNVPAFLVKLWKLVEDSSCNDLIEWSEHGTSFIIRDQTKFSKELLPQYFKHNNMASFIRQLNMYGFRKVMNYEKSGLRNENDEMEFMHGFFCKGQSSLLELIKRKIPNTKVSSEPAVKSNPRDILTDLSSIREKQENMDNMLLKMKKENELLWRELTCMRKKHKAQEQIIQKVIQFLVSIVQQSNQNIGVQRKIARMLQDSPSNKGKSQVTCTIDVLRKKNPNFITVEPDKLVSPLGPVIHEVTDFEHEQEENPIFPTVKSPEENIENYSENVPVDEIEESECPMNSSLNSPINTSANMEPLSILESLQSNTPILNDDCCLEESVLGLPFECVSDSDPIGNVISISEKPSNNFIYLPDATSVDLSFDISAPGTIICESDNLNYDDSMSESLQTPKIPTIHIEDICPLAAKSKNQKQDEVVQHNTAKSNVDSEHNYQLALAASSSVVKPSTLTKNTLNNHIVSVEEELKWLQEKINAKVLNLDPDALLGLFSTDDTANNEVLAEALAAQANFKIEPNDIVGNEIVQFGSPSLFEFDIDNGNNQFVECPDHALMSIEDDKNISDVKNYLLMDILNSSDQASAASEAAEYLLSNESPPKHKSQRRPRTSEKLQKVKRRKIK